jgi:hypothetical protein
MICTYCHNDNPNHAQYCSQCGKPTIINASANGMNMNVAAVWIYVAYQLIVTFFYRIVSYVIIPIITKGGNYGSVAKLYQTTSVIFLLFELIVCGIIIGIIKNTPARIAVGLMGFVGLLMFILDKTLMYLR